MDKKSVVLSVLILLSVSIFLFGREGISTAYTIKEDSTELWVDDNYNETLCSAAGHTWGYDCFNTLEDAREALDDECTLNIAAGNYTPNSTILIEKDEVKVLGPQADIDPRPSQGSARTADSADEAIIDGSVYGLSNIIKIDGDEVTINGLSIKSGTGDMITQSNLHSGTEVKYCIIYDGRGDEGAQLKKCTDCALEYNHVFEIADAGDGLNIADDSSDSSISYNEIHGIHGENAAIYIYDAEDMRIIGNLVYDSGTGGNDGIKVGSKDGSDASKKGVIIKDNIIHGMPQDGVSVYMSDVVIEGNEIYDCHSENGIIYLAFDIEDIKIENNTIYENSLDSSKWGDPAGIFVGPDVKIGSVSVNENIIYNNTPKDFSNHGSDTLILGPNHWGYSDPNFDAIFSGKVNQSVWYTTKNKRSMKGVTYKSEDGTYEYITLKHNHTINVNGVIVEMLEGTLISGNETCWDGTVFSPQFKSNPKVNPSAKPGKSVVLGKVFEIGFEGCRLIFDKAVKISILDSTGELVGFVEGNDTFYMIDIVCNETNREWGDNNLDDEGHCYFDDGTDLVVLTKHFTEFVTYTQTDTPTETPTRDLTGSGGRKWISIEASEPIEEEEEKKKGEEKEEEEEEEKKKEEEKEEEEEEESLTSEETTVTEKAEPKITDRQLLGISIVLFLVMILFIVESQSRIHRKNYRRLKKKIKRIFP